MKPRSACACGCGGGARKGQALGTLERSGIVLSCDSRAVEVDLRRLRTTSLRGADAVPLQELWLSALMPFELSRLTFDFVGYDGFRSSSLGGGKLGGPLFKEGYLLIEGRRPVWDESLRIPCFFRVKGVERIVATRT